MTDAWEREEEQAENDFADGLLTNEEFKKVIRDISRDRREAALESAHGAYDRELENW